MWQAQQNERFSGHSAFRVPHSAFAGTTAAPSRRAFTLVELLVVITIIGILAALLIPAATGALRRGREARINAEITQIENALENFRNNVGAYPPNTTVDDLTVDGTSGPINESVILADFRRFFNKAFPNHREPAELIDALVGLSPTAAPGDVDDPGEASNLLGGMNAAESLVFWLGGFSEDPKYPISGPGGPSYADADSPGSPSALADPVGERNWEPQIEVARLAPRNSETQVFNDSAEEGERYLLYTDPRNAGIVRRINFWRLPAPGVDTPYLYFDTSRASSITAANDVSAGSPLVADEPGVQAPIFGTMTNIFAIKRLGPGGSSTPILDRLEFANDNKFQVLASGVDNEWGAFPRVDPGASTTATALSDVLDPLPLVFPAGPWPEELSDTLSNFASGRLEDSQP